MNYPHTTLCVAAMIAGTAVLSAERSISLSPLGVYESGVFDEGAAEIVAHDPATQHVFVVNANDATVDVLDISNPSLPVKIGSIDVSPYGKVANSVAVHRGLIAVAVENEDKQAPGRIAFFNSSLKFISSVEVGSLPDMVTFTPNGRFAVVANEGEPNDDYTVDPEGTVSIIDLSSGARRLRQTDVRTADFRAFSFDANDSVASGKPHGFIHRFLCAFRDHGKSHGRFCKKPRPMVLDPEIRIFGPGSSIAQDIEPEYITVSSRFQNRLCDLSGKQRPRHQSTSASAKVTSPEEPRFQGPRRSERQPPGQQFIDPCARSRPSAPLSAASRSRSAASPACTIEGIDACTGHLQVRRHHRPRPECRTDRHPASLPAPGFRP